MSISAIQFANDLYDEHIEEASFLQEMVLSSLQESVFHSDIQSEFNWIDAREDEDRREAHIDALAIGQSAALARCGNAAADGDMELYVYASVILRQGRVHEFAWRVSEKVQQTIESLIALTAALSEHADDKQLNDLGSRNLDKCCNMTLLAIKRAMEQRQGSMPLEALNKELQARLNTVLQLQPKESNSTVDPSMSKQVELFGTVADSAFSQAHQLGAHSDNDIVRIESICNILRFGSFSDKDRLRHQANPDQNDHAAIMVGSDAAYAHHLISTIGSSQCQSTLQALALCGLPDVVRTLVQLLTSDLAETAAAALYCITGAELYENVFEEEWIDEDTLFEEELTAYQKAGTKPTRPDGSPFGEERSRFSTDPNRWKQWLKTNQARFVAGTRYRLGQAITPDSLVCTLQHERIPSWIRFYTEKELRCRYGITAPFDVTLSVRHQLRLLALMKQSVTTLQNIIPGKWYIDGRIISGSE